MNGGNDQQREQTAVSESPRVKSLRRHQEELLAELLEILDLAPPGHAGVNPVLAVDADDYRKMQAALAQYTITVCTEFGAIS